MAQLSLSSGRLLAGALRAGSASPGFTAAAALEAQMHAMAGCLLAPAPLLLTAVTPDAMAEWLGAALASLKQLQGAPGDASSKGGWVGGRVGVLPAAHSPVCLLSGNLGCPMSHCPMPLAKWR